jgi:hypothetical protein
MKKNQERRLHRKNAKIVKEGGLPMQLNRPVKPDTTRRCGHCGQLGHMSKFIRPSSRITRTGRVVSSHTHALFQKPIASVPNGQNSTHLRRQALGRR